MANSMDNDKEYENYLEGRSGVSQLYRKTQTTEPTPETDYAILAAARREVRSKPKSVSPFGYRWMVPASLAAVLVLTVSIIMLQPPSIESTSEPEKLAKSDQDRSAPQVAAKQQLRQDDDKASLAMNRELEEKSLGEVRKKEKVLGDAITPTEQALPEQEKYAAAPKPAISAETEGALSSAATSTPEKWLGKIEKLLNENKKDEASNEFKAFNKAFPDYQIDFKRYPKLQALVKTPE